MPENDGSIGPTDIAILSARMGVMRMGASRMGFYPDDVKGSGDEPGEYPWKETFPPETTWTLASLYSFCGRRPIASFTDLPDPSDEDEVVTFTDTSTGDITFWHWTFGDGSESYDQNPTHAYVTAGTYEVTLSVSGPRGSDIVSGSHVVEVGLGSISGQTDVGEAYAVPGVDVSLYLDPDTTTPIATDVSDALGLYSFPALAAGTYYVRGVYAVDGSNGYSTVVLAAGQDATQAITCYIPGDTWPPV